MNLINSLKNLAVQSVQGGCLHNLFRRIDRTSSISNAIEDQLTTKVQELLSQPSTQITSERFSDSSVHLTNFKSHCGTNTKNDRQQHNRLNFIAHTTINSSSSESFFCSNQSLIRAMQNNMFRHHSSSIMTRTGVRLLSTFTSEQLTVKNEENKPCEIIIERDDLQQKIQTILNNQNKPIKELAIVGMYGSGKTVLARVYVRNYENTITKINGTKPLTYFINARKERYLTSFEELAIILNVDLRGLRKSHNLYGYSHFSNQERQNYEAELSKRIQKELRKHSNWLLVFDHVENFSDIEVFIPNEISLKGIVLFTSQNTRLFTVSNRIDLNENPFSKDEAIKLLEKTAKIDNDIAGANELVEILNLHPLSIHIAGCYIQKKNNLKLITTLIFYIKNL